jgi:hypothetical protein
MCYGNLDPKHALREMDDRLKFVARQPDISIKNAPRPAFAPVAWVRAALSCLKRKDEAHV